MIVSDIFYTEKFEEQFIKLPQQIKKIAIKKEAIFRSNPLHPSLRLHPLKGKLAGLFFISLTLSYRIIFDRQKSGKIIFISIGKHNIYEHL